MTVKKIRFLAQLLVNAVINGLTLLGLGGGNIAPLTFERLSSKNHLSHWSITFWQFLNMYILWLKKKKKCYLYSDRLLGGVSNLPVKKFCAYLYFVWVLFIFYHVGCLNILYLVTNLIFWVKKKFEALWLMSYFVAIFWPCFIGHFISRASARRSACALF